MKIGGSVLESILTDQTLEDFAQVAVENKLVVVHGGGDEVTSLANRLGVEQRFVTSPAGFRARYTDDQTVDLLAMALAGKVNKKIVSRLQALKIAAVGISGVDGGLIRAERKRRLVEVDERGRKRVIDGGYTGRVTSVNEALIQVLLEHNFVPVVAPLALGSEFEILNVNGDRVAAHVAGELGADALLFATDVEGLMLDGKLIRELAASRAKAGLNHVGPGMITKVYAAVEAVELGVKEAIISPGYGQKPITSALAHEIGTLIKP